MSKDDDRCTLSSERQFVLMNYRLSVCCSLVAVALFLSVQSASAQSNLPPQAEVTTYFTRWHIPDLCHGERDYNICDVQYALTTDDTELYAFIYQTATLYRYADGENPTIYDLRKFFPNLNWVTTITPFGSDFVLINDGNRIFKYQLATHSISEVAKGKYPGFMPCQTNTVMKSSGLVLVCQKNHETLNLSLLNPFTEQWTVVGKEVSGTTPYWTALLAGQDNKLYMQLETEYAAYSFSKLAVMDLSFIELTLQNKDWITHPIPVSQVRDWKTVHLSLGPGPVDAFLSAVDSHSNAYFSLYWNENIADHAKQHHDLFKTSADGSLVWLLSDTPYRILDVSSDGMLVVSETDEASRETVVKWITINSK